MCIVGIFFPKNIDSENTSPLCTWCIITSVKEGSSNTSSFVTPSETSALYHARFVGPNTVNATGGLEQTLEPAATIASAKNPN